MSACEKICATVTRYRAVIFVRFVCVEFNLIVRCVTNVTWSPGELDLDIR